MSYKANSVNSNLNVKMEGTVNYTENQLPVGNSIADYSVFNSKTFKEGTKIILPNKEEYELPDEMSIEEILESLKEDAAYSNITEQNVTVDDDGNVRISNPKVRVNGSMPFTGTRFRKVK